MEELDRVLLEGDQEAIDGAFKALLEQYPTSSVLWTCYAQWKFLNGDYPGLETIFTQTLKTLPSVKLWQLYLSYLKTSNAPTGVEPEERAQYNAVLSKAYESAVLHVGLDVDSLPIWRDYIEFVKSIPAGNFYEQQQVMDQTRKLYHRALLMPIDGIEALWSSYDAYENSLNKLTAKKMLSDRSPSYMLARSFCKELKDLVVGCDRDWVPSATLDGNRLLVWMCWVAWERSNPLGIAEGPVLHARIAYAFKCAMAALRLYPEVAFEYAKYLQERGLGKEAEAVLKQACLTIPCSLLVNFALADVYEAADSISEATAAYEELTKELEAKVATFPDLLSLEAGQAAQDLTLAFIQWMHFARRSPSGIPAARAVFTRARKNVACTSQLFIAAARMEYHCKKDAVVAGKIFELGMARFGSQPEYVLEYLNHLILLNDDANTRALFERSLQLIPAGEPALEVWKLYLDFEFNYGDTKSISALEKRFKVIFPSHPIARDISLFARRFGFGELQPTEERVWSLLQATPHPHSEPIARGPKVRLAFNTDSMANLALLLPPPHLYTGQVIDPDALVRLLQTAQEPNRYASRDRDRPKEPTRHRDTHTTSSSSGKARRDRRGARDHRSRSRDRRDRDRHRASAGGSGKASRHRSRSESPAAAKHDDIFEQRFRQREADRK